MPFLRNIRGTFYHALVEKNTYVAQEYNTYANNHLEEHKKKPWKHWWMLFRLNWHYRVCKRTERLYVASASQFASRAKLPYLEGAESEISKRRDPMFFAKDLMQYDVVSFDIFDTLILRPFSSPADLFMLVGKRLNKVEFYRIRTDAEKRAREQASLQKGNREVTIHDIYSIIEERTGIPKEIGIQTELEAEMQYCFANPYMKRVFRLLKEHGKTVIIVSDMYLPHEMMEKLLQSAGYTGYDKLYVSCDYGCSKSTKSLYQHVKQDYSGKKIVHIGDNHFSDIKCAEAVGLETRYYKNCHEIGNPYRADGMSELVGSAYAGIVNTHLHNGIKTYSPYYEYGFTYGGLYVFGFCNWMHRKAKKENIDKILFLSRDGAIYQRVFNMMFDDVPNEYFLWSRIANTKYTLKKNRDDFLKRMVFYRSLSPIPSSISSLLSALSLQELAEYLSEYDLTPDALVVPENVKPLERLFIDKWDLVCNAMEPEKKIITKYIKEKVGDAKKVAIVDVGWLGSGPMGLKYLIEEELDLDCHVSCWQAAARPPIHNDILPELMDDTIEPYIFSRFYNRNHYDIHTNTNRGLNNAFFEIFTQDVTPSYSGVTQNGTFRFDIPEVENDEIITQTHQGIYDFCKIYRQTFTNDGYMFNISGYDAYLPYRMIIRDLSFLKKHFSRMTFARTVAGDAKNQRLETVSDLLQQVGL